MQREEELTQTSKSAGLTREKEKRRHSVIHEDHLWLHNIDLNMNHVRGKCLFLLKMASILNNKAKIPIGYLSWNAKTTKVVLYCIFKNHTGYCCTASPMLNIQTKAGTV